MWEVQFHMHLSQQSTNLCTSMFVDKNKAYKKCYYVLVFFLSKPIPPCDTWCPVNMSRATILYLNRCNSSDHVIFLLHHVSVGQTPSSVVPLTRNWAMSKAKSWTKLNRCSANDATRPKPDFWSSGSPGTCLLTAHKVTDTTSQQSWAARWQSTKEDSQGRETREERMSIILWIFNCVKQRIGIQARALFSLPLRITPNKNITIKNWL